MKYIWLIIGWFFTLVFSLLTVSMILTGNIGAAVPVFLLLLLSLPPVSGMLKKRVRKRSLYHILRLALIFFLLFLFARLLIGGEVTSIYKSPEVKAEFVRIYDEKMKEWPLPFDDIFLVTTYGTVHVIASGPADASPLLLLHASGTAGWSWKYNAAGLGSLFRLYAVDLIGDAGKSELADMGHVMKTGQDQAGLYCEIMDSLGIQSAYIAGASEGGFIGSNIALYAPERVRKLALLGPMGYSGAAQSIFRIAIAQMFPLKPIQQSTFSWAFSNSPMLEKEFETWFPLLMSAVFPVKVPPLTIPERLRSSISVPVMFIFGSRDNLVGDPEKARELVQDIPDVRVHIVEAGHLMAAELPDEVNALLIDFFNETEE
ncbi:alpha/beta fold hydrolase [bacterium]|nr:alpha/beta fold hydrolase [bacterium]